MTIADTLTPVVVLASPHHGGLGVTRSLGRLGVPVFNVDPVRWTPALLSRYCRGKLIWDLDQAPPEKSVDYLVNVARDVRQRSILIPTTDNAAMFVADYADALKEWYIFPAQSGDLVHSLCSKREMHSLAGKLRTPTPMTLYFDSRADLIDSLKNIELPVMIKGVNGQLRKRASKTKLIIRNRPEILNLCNRIDDRTARNLIVQEYIPGGEDTVWMFNGYFNQRSECMVGFTGRKIRQCPAYTGVTSLGICQQNDVVKETARKFIKAVGYRGIVDMDFRYDARDGVYKLLDVNPRIGSTFRLFVSESGMDVVRALYLDMTKQPVKPAWAANGRKWIVEDFDLAASFRYWQDRKLTFWEWLSSLRGIQESAFFAADDPLPMLAMMRADVRELFHRVQPRRRAVQPFEYESSAAVSAGELR